MPIIGKAIVIPTTTTLAALSIIDQFVAPQLGDLMRIKVHGELGVPDRSRSIIQYEFCPMITHKGIAPQFRHNRLDSLLAEGTDYTLSLDNAQLTLLGSSGSAFQGTAGQLPIGDEIEGFYRFQYFTDTELESYILLGLDALNARKPTTAFVLEGAPREWNQPLVIYTYIEGLKRILTDTTLWRSSVIFTDPAVVRAHLQERMQAMEQRWDFESKVSQRRGWAAPKLIFSQRIATQQRVTPVNFRDFTIQI